MRLIIAFILSSINLLSYGQKTVVIDQPHVGLPEFYDGRKTTEIDSLKQLPSEIQIIVTETIQKSMTDFANTIQFVRGQYYDDYSLKTDTISPISSRYYLSFELTDVSLGIRKYSFELCVDDSGHVAFLGWPNVGYNKRKDFIDPQILKKKAIEFAKGKRYKTNSCEYELKYNKELNKLCWCFLFEQYFRGNKFEYYKESKTIIMDAISLEVVKEVSTVSVGQH